MQLCATKKANPFRRNRLLRDASYQAVYDAMVLDDSIHIFGEGAEVKVHYDAPKIESEYSERVHTLPISEDGNVNFAVGASLLGVKPIVDIIGADFLYRCMDSIANTAAKLNFLRPGEEGRTIVIRSEFMTGGPTTGQRPEALFAHIPGLRVVVPSTPRDAYGLMRSALGTPGVTLYFEDRMVEDDGFFLDSDLKVGETVPFGEGAWRRFGQRGTVLIVTYGVMRQRVERIVNEWGKGDPYRQPNLDCFVMDLRSICPWDYPLAREMLRRTGGNLLIVEPDIAYGGVGAEIAACMAETRPGTKVKRLGARKATTPAAQALHDSMLPTDEEIVNAIREFTDYS